MTTILAVDVGNTNVVLGVYENERLVRTWRLAPVHDRTEDELAVSIDGLLAQEDLALNELDALVVGSVVPPLTTAFTRLAERYLERPPFIVGPGIKTCVKLRVDTPSEVGADRIANTLAAHRRYGGPAIVVDFGTTTNFDVVSEDGDFLGGSFAPGLEISAESLFGYVGLVEGLLTRIIAELPAKPRVIATGGLAPTIAPLARGIESVDEDLTLEGLRMLYELNA